MAESSARPERRKEDIQAREVAERHDREVKKIQYAMQDAWLTSHGLTRFVRFILVILITFLATTAFVQTNNRKTCENGKVFLRAYTADVATRIKSRQATLKDPTTSPSERKSNRETIQSYQAQLALLKPGLEQNCARTYPILPFVHI